MSNSLNWISKFTRALLKDSSAAMRTEEASSVSMGSSSSVSDSSCDKEGFQCEQEIKVYVQTKKLSKATDSDDTTSIYLSSYTGSEGQGEPKEISYSAKKKLKEDDQIKIM